MSTVPPKPKPGGLAFLVPAVIWIVFSIVATVLLVNAISRQDDIIDDFVRVDDGEEATVTLEEGGHTIWLERPGVDDELLYGSELDVEITAPDGSTVSTDIYDTEATYSQGGRDGTAALTFDARVDGEYTIAPTVNDFRGGTIAIGTENPISALGIGFALFFGIGTIGFLIALVILIVLLVKRSRSRKQIRAANAAAFGYPQPGYAAAGGYAAGSYPPSSYGVPPGYAPPGAYPPPGGAAPPGVPGPPPPPPAPGPFGSPPTPPPPPG